MTTSTAPTRAILLGFGVALALLVALVAVVGVDEVLDALAAARPADLAVLLGTAALWTVAWSGTMYGVFGVVGVPSTRRRTVLVYATLQFANNVAPFSVAGGEPLAALFVSRATRSDFETALAAVVSTDALNYVPGPALALVGLVALFVAPGVDPAFGRTAGRAAVVVAVASLALVVVAAGAWRARRRLADVAARLLVAVGAAAHRLVPRLPSPSEAAVADRLDRLVAALERVAGSPRTLLVGLGWATAGWLLLAACLWLALVAVGQPAAFGVLVFVVPVVNVTDLVPLPGGVGTMEPVLVLLLDVLAGVPLAEATAAVLLYRAATFWVPVVVGGGLVVALTRAGGGGPDGGGADGER